MYLLYRVLSAGSNQRLSVNSSISLLAVLFFALASPHAQAQGVIDLGVLPDGSRSSAWAINNDGDIAGNCYIMTSYFAHAVIWQNMQISSIHDTAQARDINSFGVVVGTAEDRVNISRAAKWFGGGIETVPYLPDGKYSDGYGINDSGWVVGDYDDTTTSAAYTVPFLWKGNTVTRLPLLNSQGSGSARRINNNGIAVGYATPYSHCYIWYACAWFNGKVYPLLPAGINSRSFAFDINDSNVIVGTSDLAEGYPGVLTTWKATIVNGTDLQISAPIAAPPDYEFVIFYESPGTPVAINNLNTIVGVGVDTLDNTRDLFIYQDGAFGDLGGLVNVAYASSNSNSYGIDINDSGQIVGTGVFSSVNHGFLLTAKYLSVNTPSENGLMVAGETNLISWMHLGVNTINIYYQIGESPDLHLIVDNYPAENNYFVWDVPDTLLSTKVKIRIEDVNSSVYAESKMFRIKGYVLTRLNAAGDYERFRSDIDGWKFANNANPMWPASWYNRFDYIGGNDPNTKTGYPQDPEYPFFEAKRSDFVDWPVLTETFGMDQCYIAGDGGSLEYKREATEFWRGYKGKFGGCCLGLAASAILAFDDKAGFLSFSGLPDFDTLYNVPVSDTNRKVIHRLYYAQFGTAEDAYHVTTSSKTAVDVLAELKAMLLSDTNDHRSMSLYSHHEPVGGHTMVPYRVIKDPGNPAMYRVYAYDSNNPGDTGIFMTVDTVANRWTFPDLTWSEVIPGTWILDRPASSYMQQQQFESTAKAGPPLAAKANGNSDYMKILNSDAKDVRIVGMGESVKYDTINGITISGPLAVWPIIPATGGPHRPLGFYLPRPCPDPYGYDRFYNVWLSQLGDSNVYVSFRTDSVIWNYSRHHADSTQMDCFVYLETSKEQGVVVYFGSEGNRTVDIGAILPGDNSEKALDVTILSIVPGNSIQTSYRQDGDFSIRNTGSGFPTYCNFRLTNISTGGTGLFKYDSLYLDGEASYIIHNPNWDSLDTAPLKILIDLGGNGTIDDSLILNNQATDVDESGDLGLPKTFQLCHNYPNPFNPATTIEYSLPHRADVVIEIFDVLGRKVRQLVNETKAAGVYQVTWNGTDQSGVPVSTGVYLYRIQAGDFVESRKMLLIK
jgi:uncharacterized membrane protein